MRGILNISDLAWEIGNFLDDSDLNVYLLDDALDASKEKAKEISVFFSEILKEVVYGESGNKELSKKFVEFIKDSIDFCDKFIATPKEEVEEFSVKFENCEITGFPQESIEDGLPIAPLEDDLLKIHNIFDAKVKTLKEKIDEMRGFFKALKEEVEEEEVEEEEVE